MRLSPRQREQGMVNATKAVGPHGFRQAVVNGCTDCMVNAVQKHAKDFNAEGVHGIFMDLALLSARDLADEPQANRPLHRVGASAFTAASSLALFRYWRHHATSAAKETT